MDVVVRAAVRPRLPVVLTRAEVVAVLGEMRGVPRLVATLLYGAGLRLQEALELHVKDVDVERRQITIRQGKGRKDRVTMVPAAAVAALKSPTGSRAAATRVGSRGGRGPSAGA